MFHKLVAHISKWPTLPNCLHHQTRDALFASKRTYIARGGVLSGAEGLSRAQAVQKGAVEGAAEAAAERPQRAVRKCSICKSTEHTARTCPRRQATS